MNYDELVEQQGWNDETMLGLALQFIKDRGLWEAFESTLELQAIEENEIVGPSRNSAAVTSTWRETPRASSILMSSSSKRISKAVSFSV